MKVLNPLPWVTADTVQWLHVPLSAKWPTVRIMQHHQEMGQCWVCRQAQLVLRYLFTFRCNRYIQASETCSWTAQILRTVTSDIALVARVYLDLLGNVCYKCLISHFSHCSFGFNVQLACNSCYLFLIKKACVMIRSRKAPPPSLMGPVDGSGAVHPGQNMQPSWTTTNPITVSLLLIRAF